MLLVFPRRRANPAKGGKVNLSCTKREAWRATLAPRLAPLSFHELCHEQRTPGLLLRSMYPSRFSKVILGYPRWNESNSSARRGERGRRKRAREKKVGAVLEEHLIFQLARFLSMEWRPIMSKKERFLDLVSNRIFLSFLFYHLGGNNRGLIFFFRFIAIFSRLFARE